MEIAAQASELVDIHYVRQESPLGLGHRVSKTKNFLADAAFALLLCDVIIEESALHLDMINLEQRTGSSVIALVEVPTKSVSALVSQKWMNTSPPKTS